MKNLLTTLFALASVPLSNGAVITNSFTGIIDVVEMNENGILGVIGTGDAISGSFSFDPLTVGGGTASDRTLKPGRIRFPSCGWRRSRKNALGSHPCLAPDFRAMRSLHGPGHVPDQRKINQMKGPCGRDAGAAGLVGCGLAIRGAGECDGGHGTLGAGTQRD
ncbi:MAG: hypothetical protein RLZZ522_1306 [Verrucomicrobiota bacterium]|jgi:hypothetical protein